MTIIPFNTASRQYRLILGRIVQTLSFFLLLIISPFLQAQVEPLKIAVVSFAPPFIMQAGNNQFYGFEIGMMQNLCKRLNRTCQYQAMRFDEILPAVEEGRMDIGMGLIFITPARYERVNFSLPYFISQSRFIGKTELSKEPFGLQLLHNKRIGIERGTIYRDQINELGVQNPRIIEYNSVQDIMQALNDGKIDLALLNSSSASFWEIQSNGLLKALGTPLEYGLGAGLAISKKNPDLVKQINRVLMDYQNSQDFKDDFKKYLGQRIQ